MIIVGVISVSGCIGGETSPNQSINFNGFSFDVPNNVKQAQSASKNNALIYYQNTSYDIGVNDVYGYDNPDISVYGDNVKNKSIDNISYVYITSKGNSKLHQGNITTIKVYFRKNGTNFYIITNTKNNSNITQVNKFIENTIKTIHPI
ncbi:hypothetical protein [Methanobrevibacter sp.]|uniref:hypothetical protein n=1 Tax=Methanobrevibacter sp. TaxID=66852 RepID=UPI002FDB4DDF